MPQYDVVVRTNDDHEHVLFDYTVNGQDAAAELADALRDLCRTLCGGCDLVTVSWEHIIHVATNEPRA